jgi:hypothetical protein
LLGSGSRVATTPTERLAARIPGDRFGRSPGQVSIGFQLTRTIRPCDSDSNNPDTQRLGIALSRIRLVRA